VPVAEEVDAVIIASTCACECKVEACQGGLYEVFIVSTDIDCGA